MKTLITSLIALTFPLTILAREIPGPPTEFDGSLLSDASLQWDPSPDHDKLKNYTIHWGEESGVYSMSKDVGTNLFTTISNLPAGMTLYFAASAVGTNQLRSDFSNELVYKVPEEGARVQTTNRIGSASIVKVILEGSTDGTDSYREIQSWSFILLTKSTNAVIRSRLMITSEENVITWE